MSVNVDKKYLEALAEGSNRFAIELYQTLKGSSENLIVSPISIQIVLALAFTGARGNTAKQIAHALHLPKDRDATLKGHQALLKHLANPALKLATKMFVDDSLKLNEEFQNGAKIFFMSEAKQIGFSSDSESARLEINKWVEENTQEKIKDLLAQGTIDALTRLVLVNAIHFKADWKFKFNPELTHDAPFHVTNNKKVTVQMMQKSDDFPFAYHEGLKAKIIELPYINDDFRMVIILPDEIEGLAAVESKLAKLNLAAELDKLVEQKVDVSLPKFKLEQTMNLNDILSKMGIKDMFDDTKADFSGMSDTFLHTSKVIQKAFIEVNEEGTEAAAATAKKRIARSIQSEPPSFNANRPFGFILSHLPSVSVVFAARVYNPLD